MLSDRSEGPAEKPRLVVAAAFRFECRGGLACEVVCLSAALDTWHMSDAEEGDPERVGRTEKEVARQWPGALPTGLRGDRHDVALPARCRRTRSRVAHRAQQYSRPPPDASMNGVMHGALAQRFVRPLTPDATANSNGPAS